MTATARGMPSSIAPPRGHRSGCYNRRPCAHRGARCSSSSRRLTFFVGLGRPAISDSDEAYYAEAGREMVESGDWLTPHFNYTDRFQKPILFYWIVSASYRVAGRQRAAARARRGAVRPRPRPARRHGVRPRGGTTRRRGCWRARSWPPASAASRWPAPPAAGHAAGLLHHAAIWAAFVALIERRPSARRWWLLAAAAAALGVPDQGAARPRHPGRRAAAGRATRAPLAPAAGRPAPASPLLMFLLVAAPWYAPMTPRTRAAYLRGFFVGDNLERFATTRSTIRDRSSSTCPSCWRHAALVSVLPGCPSVASRRWQARNSGSRLAMRRLVVWALLPLLLSHGLGRQAAALHPAGAAAARSAARHASSGERIATGRRAWPGPRRDCSAPPGCAPGLLLVGRRPAGDAHGAPAPAWRAARPRGDDRRRLRLGACRRRAVAVVTVALGARGRRRCGRGHDRAAADDRRGAGFSSRSSGWPSRSLAHRRASEPIGSYRVFVRNLVFYTHVQQDAALQRRERPWPSSARRIASCACCPRRDAARLEQATRSPRGRPPGDVPGSTLESDDRLRRCDVHD